MRVSAVETERHAVILVHPNGIAAAMQRMKAHPRHRHLRRLGHGIEGSKDQVQAFRVLRLHFASIPCLEKRRQPLVPESLDHGAQCNLIGYHPKPIWLQRIQRNKTV